jgi:hypothetical protein
VIALLLACHAGPDSDVDTDTDRPIAVDTDTTVDTDRPPPEDVDQDGFATTTDCDDYDPAVHPGAAESWNGDDDDCDGRIDGDGTYSGTHHVDGAAIVEGQTVRFAVDCPTELVRAGPHLAFTATCTPDPSDTTATMLIGEQMTIREQENIATDGHWAGSTRVESSDGWHVAGTGTATWDGWAAVALTTRLDTVSLDLTGSGTLDLTP